MAGTQCNLRTPKRSEEVRRSGEAVNGAQADAKRKARSGGHQKCAVAAKPSTARRPTLSAKRAAAATRSAP